jgi:hypothetical protein
MLVLSLNSSCSCMDWNVLQFAVRIANNLNNKYEKTFMRLTCPNRWAGYPKPIQVKLSLIFAVRIASDPNSKIVWRSLSSYLVSCQLGSIYWESAGSLSLNSNSHQQMKAEYKIIVINFQVLSSL